MKLTCPKCHAKSTVPDERIPPAGAWARCPKCQDRFFINPASLELLSEIGGAVAAPPKQGRTQETQKLINRLRPQKETEGRTSVNAPSSGEFDFPVVFPQAAVSPWGCLIVLGIFIFAVVGLVVSGFRSANKTRQSRIIETPTSVGVHQYDENSLRGDLLTIRNKIFLNNYSRYEVAYQGSEFAVFHYYLEQLGPNLCRDIISIDIVPTYTKEGFRAIGTCQSQKRTSPILEVNWHFPSAIVNFSGVKGQSTIVLYPEHELAKQAPKPAVVDETPLTFTPGPVKNGPTGGDTQNAPKQAQPPAKDEKTNSNNDKPLKPLEITIN